MSASVLKGKSVLLCGRQSIVNVVLCRTFKRVGLELLGEIATADDLYRSVLHKAPAMIVFDLQSAGERTLAVARTISAGVRVYQVLLTGYPPEDYADAESQIQDCTFVRKPTTSGELITAMTEGYSRFLLAASGQETYFSGHAVEVEPPSQPPDLRPVADGPRVAPPPAMQHVSRGLR